MNDAKEEIRARLAVEDVVGQYIELKKAGRNFKGHSPWGTDKTPSFMVSPDKGIWHDFSSNKGGDIFSFVMEIEGIDFREALEKLAVQAGVELAKYDGGDERVAARKKRMRECLELAAKYFQVCLTQNKPVMEYVFYKRNLNRGTVEKFKIGYAPMEGRALRAFLEKRGFSEREMKDAGLLNQYGGDLFKGRVMIPLMDTVGAVVGFTGRILSDKDKNSPKYLNTPETLLYNKGRHVFGLSQAKEAIRKSDFVVVVEGNMDVISSHQAGVCEAVATAGTAMTEMHVKALSRLSSDIRLAYDGDEAGVAAAERAIGIASRMGVYLSVIDNYDGCKDADELIQKGVELWQKAVKGYVPAVEWLLGKYEDKYDLKTEKGFKEYSDTAKRLIGQLEDATLREKYERMVSEKLGVSLESFRSKELKETGRRLKKAAAVAKDDNSGPSKAEKSLAALAKFGGTEVDKELIYSKLNENELSLIYEHRYAGWGEEAKRKEIDELTQRVKEEKRQKQKENLSAAIAEAEKAGEEGRVEELLKELKVILQE
ncbi:DNA primase [Candidatus Saccharibacteria bacterium]|nr:DNA primase [Candidatus Saccharibacteria bacterium]